MARNSSIELLRIISIFLIVLCHVCSLLDWEQALDLNKLVVGVVNCIGNVAVSCFVLISGYFGIKFKWRKFINLIVITTIYCTIIAAFRYGNNPKELLMAFLTVPAYNLWFIACYLILMPLAPYINKFADSLDKKEFRNLIIILIVILCIFPTLTVKGATNDIVLRQGGKNLVYMMFLYIMGRYIRLHNDRDYNRWALWGIHLACSITVLLLNMLGTWLFNKRCAIFRFDCSPFTLLSSLSVFYLFKSWNYHSRIINWLSSSVFAFYLLSNIYYYFDAQYVNLPGYTTDNRFVFYLFLLVIAAWIFSLVVDKTLGLIINWILTKIEDGLEPRIVNSRIYKRITQ